MKSDMIVSMPYLDYVRLENYKKECESLKKEISNTVIVLKNEKRMVLLSDSFLKFMKDYVGLSLEGYYIEIDKGGYCEVNNNG